MSIKDVARIAGVSASTVSRVVNGGDNSAASPETREKIWNAVRETGYIVDQNARNLRRRDQNPRQTVRLVDCVFARVAGKSVDDFFEQLMHVIRGELQTQGYQLGQIYMLNDDRQKSRQDYADAAVILGRISEQQLLGLQNRYKHIVAVSLQNHVLPVDQVVSSGYDAVRFAIAYLRSQGHRYISYLGETGNEQRYQAYLDAMAEADIPNLSALVVNAAFSPASGYEAVNELLSRQQPVTAILCSNDILALGIYRGLAEHRLRIPRDISVMGINDKEEVRYLSPMLTSVNIPIEEMGRHAAQLLMHRISGGHRLPVTMQLPNRLIVRGSTSEAERR